MTYTFRTIHSEGDKVAKTSQSRKANELPTEVTADVAKRSFGELIARAGWGKERIAITRHGKKIAALVSAEDLKTLDGAA